MSLNVWKKKREKRVLYRQVFTTPQGRAVLTDILNDLGFYNMHRGEEDVVLTNYARRLLEKVGVWQPQNMYDITDAFLGIPWDYKEHSEEDE